MTALPWDLSRPDWAERIVAGESFMPELPLYKSEAERAVAIFKRLRLPDVPGTPTLLDACGDWFIEIVRVLFGSLDPETKVRMVRELFCLVPKKNSKTSYGAALMVTALILNRRPRAEFLLIGPTQQISELAFTQAVGMIEADPWLKDRMHIQEHKQTITVRWVSDDDRKMLPGNGAKLKVKTFDTKVLTGVKPVGVLVDELHELASVKNAHRVIGQIRGGLLPNAEGFLVFITTQSEEAPRGVFKSELKKARAIRDGKATGAMLPILYEFPADMIESGAWRDPENWWMVTPNRGRSVHIDRLAEEWDAAQISGEEEIRRWASQHLNVEIGLALLSDSWAGAKVWEPAVDLDVTLESILETCDVAVAGVDGGGLDDLLGLAILGRERETRRWKLFCRAWAYRGVLQLRQTEASRLEDFERDGDLTIVDHLGDDIDELVDIIVRVDQAGILAKVGLDPVGVGTIVDALAENDIGGEGDASREERVVGVSQGYKLTGAIKTAERKLADGTLVHAGQPLMNWCVGNAKVEPKGNAILITKQASGTAKIDPLMAAFNAVALMSMNPKPPRRVVTVEYERGQIFAAA